MNNSSPCSTGYEPGEDDLFEIEISKRETNQIETRSQQLSITERS